MLKLGVTLVLTETQVYVFVNRHLNACPLELFNFHVHGCNKSMHVCKAVAMCKYTVLCLAVQCFHLEFFHSDAVYLAAVSLECTFTL